MRIIALPPGALAWPEGKLDTLSDDLGRELEAIGALYPLRVVWARKAV